MTTSIFLFGQSKDSLSTNFLKDKLIAVKDISPSNTDFTDLKFLEEELKGVEIIMLGEQGHGDGSSFLAKTRLIKYLHEKQGFNVLVFESGMADAFRVWSQLKSGADSLAVFDLGIFPVWTQMNEVVPLMEYIIDQSKTSNPLILAGFDMQPTGSRIRAKERSGELIQYLKSVVAGFDINNYPKFSGMVSDFAGTMRNKPGQEDRDKLLDEMRTIQVLVRKNDMTIKGQVMSRYLMNLYKTFQLFWDADLANPSNTPHVFNIRDREMAKNMTYLREKVYSSEKMIVWGANTHIGYGRGLLEGDAPDKGMIPMGAYLKTDYQKKVYTLSFTSAMGKTGSLRGETYDLPEGKPGSLEAYLGQLGVEYGFLSFRNNPFGNMKFETRIYGHSEMLAKWPKMTDGVFFIKEMKGSTKR